MLALPSSPRKRRRLAWAAGGVAVAAMLAILLVFFRNTGHSYFTPFSDRPPMVLREPKHVPAAPADRQAAEQTVGAFVHTAVIRRSPERAWELATPHMREGSTRDEWAAGTLPVTPYTAGEFGSFGMTLKYSYKGVLGYDVLVIPRTPEGEQRVYSCELQKLHGRWLVEFFYPRTTL